MSLKSIKPSWKLETMNAEFREAWEEAESALWSPSYFAASCGGAPLEIIKQYIER